MCKGVRACRLYSFRKERLSTDVQFEDFRAMISSHRSVVPRTYIDQFPDPCSRFAMTNLDVSWFVEEL